MAGRVPTRDARTFSIRKEYFSMFLSHACPLSHSPPRRPQHSRKKCVGGWKGTRYFSPPSPFAVPSPCLRDALESDDAPGTTRIEDSKYRYRRDGGGDGAPLVWDVDITVHERGKTVSKPTCSLRSRCALSADVTRSTGLVPRHSSCSDCTTKRQPFRNCG